MKRTILALCLGLAVTGCSSDDVTPSPEEGDPGVARFEIQNGKELHITGFDRAGAEVGRIWARYGHFTSEEWGGEADGLMLDLTYRGVTVTHRSVGSSLLDLPAPGPADMQAFLLDPRVTAALESWGIRSHESPVPIFGNDSPDDAEAAFNSGQTCTYASTQACSSYDCCQAYLGDGWGNGAEYGQTNCCANGTGGYRTCTYPFGNSQCGATGAGGCAGCWGGWPVPAGWYCWTYYNGDCGLSGCIVGGNPCEGGASFCCSQSCTGGYCD